MKLTIVYLILACIATAANIGTQGLVAYLYHGRFALIVSICIGTGVGLFAKYSLDKAYIFKFAPKNTAHDAQTFVLYSLVGLVTTAVFWSFEFGFDYLFASAAMRYLGAVIGLGIGYFIKYRLDKRFVFQTLPA